jgi:hypothetical protein
LLHSGKLNIDQYLTITLVFTILSAISLFIVAIFYACIRELRRNIIGKSVLVLAICVAIDLILDEMKPGVVVDLLTHFLNVSNTLWFLAMAYETLVLLKYSKIFDIMFLPDH